MSWEPQNTYKERDVSPKRPTYKQRYHEAWVTVSPGREDGRKSPSRSLQMQHHHHHHHHHQHHHHQHQHQHQHQHPGYYPGPPHGYGNGPPQGYYPPTGQYYPPAPWQGYSHPPPGTQPSTPLLASHPINATGYPPSIGTATDVPENSSLVSLDSESSKESRRHRVTSKERIHQLQREKEELEKSFTEMDLERTRAEIERKEALLRVQQELDVEKDQNLQSANVIAQQMTLIDHLKAKIDVLVGHARSGMIAEEHRENHEVELTEVRTMAMNLQEQCSRQQDTIKQYESERLDLEREKLVWQREKKVAEMERDSLQQELATERSLHNKEKRTVEQIRRENAAELEDLLRQHEIEQQQQREENLHREQELNQMRLEKQELSNRVIEIQAQREEEARTLQREIEQHLSVVESLKAELRKKQVELFEDYKNWRQQLTSEKSQLAEKLQEERREMDFKVAQMTQQLEAERRRVEIEKQNVENEWKELRAARDDQRQRDKLEWDHERERLLEQLRVRQNEMEAKEQRVMVKERNIEATARELEAVCRDKAALEAEVHKLRLDNTQMQELRIEKERWQRECTEQGEKWRQQLHEVRDRHHAKLEEQCRKHTEAIEMVNKLRAQIAGKGEGPPTNPRDVAYLEKKLQETERKLLESEHALGQVEGRYANTQAELAAADSRLMRAEEHIDELNRQVLEYKKELTEARSDRERFREMSRVGGEGDVQRLVDEKEALVRQLRLATLANREEKFVHLCDMHKGEGFEGLMRHDMEEDSMPLNKETSKQAYTIILTCLERIKLQPFVCAGCVTEMHHSFDRLLRMLFTLDDTAGEITETEDVMVFLMALTSRLSEVGERKVHNAADSLLKIILTLDG